MSLKLRMVVVGVIAGLLGSMVVAPTVSAQEQRRSDEAPTVTVQLDRTDTVTDRPADRVTDRPVDRRPEHDEINYRKLFWRLVHAGEWGLVVRLLHHLGLI